MAIFQPSHVVPDVRSGLGLGTIDATRDMTVSWHINGPSPMIKFQIDIYKNKLYGAVTNLIQDGNFADTNYWAGYHANFTVANHVGVSRGSSFLNYPQLYRSGISTVPGHIYYLRAEIKYDWTGTGAPVMRGDVVLSDPGDPSGSIYSASNYPLDNSWHPMSLRGAFQANSCNVGLDLPRDSGTRGYDGLEVLWRNVLLIDLTESYGEGKEPSKEQMDQVPYFQGSTYAPVGASESGTPLYSTGILTDGCPAYGNSSTGEMQFFSYTIPASALSSAEITNGNEYKLIITQWWGNNESVTQNSASVFKTRKTPTLILGPVGTGGVINTRYFTFSGDYRQEQGDTLNWFRWRIAYANEQNVITGDMLYDSGNITGTMDISCYFDGFFSGAKYGARLTAQTENGVEADTGWVIFSASYPMPYVPGNAVASCEAGTDAVKVDFSGINDIPGVAVGPYTITDDPKKLNLPAGSSVVWSNVSGSPMSFDAPWSVIWKGRLWNVAGALSYLSFLEIGQSDGREVSLTYSTSRSEIWALKSYFGSLATVPNIRNTPTLTIIMTPTKLYVRSEYTTGGLYPSGTLYPSGSLYPREDTTPVVDTFEFDLSYNQSAITSVSISGDQLCDYLEVIQGVPSQQTITEAWEQGTYTPGINEADYMLADWTDGLDAGNLNVGGQTIQGYAIYRRQGSGVVLRHITDVGFRTKQVYDYGAASQQGPYSYYVFPIGTDSYIASPIISEPISPCWWNWTVTECRVDESGRYQVIAAYRFRNNIASGSMSNNNQPSVLNNFTPYPKVQLAPQNYKGGTLTGLIGAVDYSDGQPVYMDSITLRDAIFALSVSRNDLFLKNRKGDLIKIRFSGPVGMETGDNTIQQTQTMSLPWVEVGSAENVSLYAAENMEVSP